MRGPRQLWHDWVRRSRTKSPWIVHFDCGGCNGCDIEVLDTLTPRHSAERFGVVNVGDPRQADLLVVTGPGNRRNAGVLRTVYEQMSEPKAVVAIGSCAAHGGIFRGSPNVLDGVGLVVPVDVFVAGCPPPPQKILAGLLDAVQLLAAVRPDRVPTGGPGGPSLVTQSPDLRLARDSRWPEASRGESPPADPSVRESANAHAG
jgi:ech hydrogenase subunit C